MKEGENWFKVFRAGTWRAGNTGKTYTFGVADLQTAATMYNGQSEDQKRLAPFVIGHPDIEKMAYGYAKEFRVVGDSLEVLPSRVAPEFAKWVNEGRLPARSMKFRKDMMPLHVGFLGDVQPAVPGLGEITLAEFEEEGDEYVIFSDPSSWAVREMAGFMRRMREWLLVKFGQETADNVTPNFTIQDMETQAAVDLAARSASTSFSDDEDTMTEEERRAAEAAQAAKDAAIEARFAALEAENTTVRAQLATAQTQQQALTGQLQEAAFNEFVSSPEMRTRLTPAIASKVRRIVNVLPNGESYEFADGDGKTIKTDALSELKDILRMIPEQYTLEAIAFGGVGPTTSQEEDDKELDKFAAATSRP